MIVSNEIISIVGFSSETPVNSSEDSSSQLLINGHHSLTHQEQSDTKVAIDLFLFSFIFLYRLILGSTSRYLSINSKIGHKFVRLFSINEGKQSF